MARSVLAAAVAVLALAVPAAAQDPAARARDALKLFQAERADAAGALPAGALADADALAARAEGALAAGDTLAALRLVRDARWQVPARPAGLPAGVAHVLGGGRLRHADRVNDAAFTPDGTKLLTASRDGTVRVWDTGNGRELVNYRGHPAPADAPEQTDVFRVAALAISPDGLTAATAGGGGVHLWTVATGGKVRVLAGPPAPHRGLAFTPDGKTLVTAGDDRRVTVWDVATGKQLGQSAEQPASRIEALAVHAGGKLVATGNAKGELYVYPLDADGVKPNTIGVAVTAGEAPAVAVAFVPDSTNVLTGGGDGSVKLSAGPTPGAGQAPSGTLRTYAGHRGRTAAVVPFADGKRFATAGTDGFVVVWDLASARALTRFPVAPADPADGTDAGVTALAVSPDGAYLAAGTIDGGVKVFPLAQVDDTRATTDSAAEVWAVAVSPDGARTATAGADKLVRVYATASGKLQATLPGHAGAVCTLAFAGNDRLVTGGADKAVKLWDLATGTATDAGAHASTVLAAAADPAGKLIVTGGADKVVRAVDAAGEPLWTLARPSVVTGLAVLPGAGRVAVGTADGTLTVISATTPPKVLAATGAHTGGVAGVAAGPDGARFATAGGDGVLALWQLTAAGTIVPAGRVDPPVVPGATARTALAAVAYSPDGALVASAGADGVVRVHDAQTLIERKAFRGHAGWVSAVAFTPDGRAVVSGGTDKSVRRFDLPRPDPAAGHAGPVRSVAVSPDGAVIVTVSTDRLVKVWDRASGRLTATLSGSPSALVGVAFAGPRTVVTAGDDAKIRWWDLAAKRMTRVQPVGGRVFGLAADPATGRAAAIWNRSPENVSGVDVYAPDGTPASALVERSVEVRCAGLSADATLAALGTAAGVRVIDLRAKAQVGGDWPLFPDGPADLSMSGDGKAVVGIDGAGGAKVATTADRAAGELLKVGPAAGVFLAPAGDRFLILGPDGVVKLWSATGKELRSWPLRAAATNAAFSADGKTAVTGHGDGTATVLELP